MNCIAAVDQNWGIGRNGQLLVSIPRDMKFFREKTKGKVLVLGRKTLDSFPGGQPLKGRVHIVISRNPDSLDTSFVRAAAGEEPSEAVRRVEKGSALVVSSPEEAVSAASAFEPEDVYVIGGGTIYGALLPYCDRAYITKIDYRYDADAFFPDLDAAEEWELAEEGEEQTYFDLVYAFCTYERRS